MQIGRRRGWELPERLATPEALVLDRRALLGRGLAMGASALACALPRTALAAASDDPSAGLYPAQRNPRYEAGRAVTPEVDNTSFNNFYEFGTSKQVAKAAEALPIRPWEIRVDGLVEKPFTLAIDELLAKMRLEERVYRHRCVEAWSMVVPWTGFPLADLVALAKPRGSARYLRMETFMNPKVAPEQYDFRFPWPYVEGLTMAEATSELAFLATGAYGKPLPKVMGAPIRLHVPWKYGFKSIKSIARVSFVEKRPKGLWEALQGSEYGFWANVNPDVPHPRWSQASEEVLGTGERIKTRIYNGYGEWVAGLYADIKGEALFM